MMLTTLRFKQTGSEKSRHKRSVTFADYKEGEANYATFTYFYRSEGMLLYLMRLSMSVLMPFLEKPSASSAFQVSQSLDHAQPRPRSTPPYPISLR
jgi:hypothetical protein